MVNQTLDIQTLTSWEDVYCRPRIPPPPEVKGPAFFGVPLTHTSLGPKVWLDDFRKGNIP